MNILISIDDGHRRDLKVAHMLDKYGFRGIFFIPIMGPRQLTDDEVRQLSVNHEIGGHTVTHPTDLKLCLDHQLEYEIVQGKTFLEEIIGKKVKKFCYPRGRYDSRVIGFVEKAGFTYARTTKVGTTMPLDKRFEVDTSVHIYPRNEYENMSIMPYFNRMLQEAKIPGHGEFHLWLHSWELDKFDLWDTFEEMLVKLKEVKDESLRTQSK